MENIHLDPRIYLVFTIAFFVAFLMVVLIYKNYKKNSTTIKSQFWLVCNTIVLIVSLLWMIACGLVVTEFEILPKYVKYVEFSIVPSDKFGLESQIKNQFPQTCKNHVCTVPVLEFKHAPNATWVKFGNESNQQYLCVSGELCDSPIGFNTDKMAFGAKVSVAY